jgi:CRP/FNR family transcriptional regulator
MLDISAYASAVAGGNLTALAIPATDIRSISRRSAALRDYATSAMVLRFAEIISLVREITTRRVSHRLAEYLLGKFDESDGQPPVAAVTQQQIALDLGTAREVVSRKLQELESLGAVKVHRGRIVQLDRLALQQLST